MFFFIFSKKKKKNCCEERKQWKYKNVHMIYINTAEIFDLK